MKKILLFGAFDRYNFGDNLMPIVFNEYIKKFKSDILTDYEIEYVAISNSDLSKYKCYKTKSISNVISTLEEGSAIIVIGGEVLCGKNSDLFLHMQNKYITHLFFKTIRKITRSYFSKLVRPLYSTPWEFPFIPDPSFLPEKTKIFYNSVGGTLSNLNPIDFNDVKRRINSSDLVSVRDVRTHKQIDFSNKSLVSPDSVMAISEIIDSDKIGENVSDSVIESCDSDYIVIQAAPKKIGCSEKEMFESILNIKNETGKKLIFLPIGYASGHDDYQLLKRIYDRLDGNVELLFELNVWEILYVIMNSNMYIGTSLHGVIISIAYNIPHFGINKKITKLDEFLKDWSVYPFNKCHSFSELSELVNLDFSKPLNILSEKSDRAKKQVIENNDRIIELILDS
ncbi:MAG: polysaccharide pyruvyl transferase family protein [Vibrio splendidus]